MPWRKAYGLLDEADGGPGRPTGSQYGGDEREPRTLRACRLPVGDGEIGDDEAELVVDCVRVVVDVDHGGLTELAVFDVDSFGAGGVVDDLDDVVDREWFEWWCRAVVRSDCAVDDVHGDRVKGDERVFAAR